MKIYELRAFIGETRLYYSQLFTTMEAACKRAMYLRDEEKMDFRKGSAIYELEQNGETFEFNCLKSTPVYLT